MSDRPVATDALATLGTIIDDKQKRDAIHLAVMPVIAGMNLSVGDDIGIVDGLATRLTPIKLGIVDPFLKEVVKEGEHFWLIIYPRQINSLRHVWSHPGISDEIETQAIDKSFSEKWMRNWAMENVSYDYYGESGKLDEDTAYSFAIKAGHTNNIGPYEDAREHINNEWWNHWESITGTKGDRDSYFSCAC